MRKIVSILFLTMLGSQLAAQQVNTFNKTYSIIPGYGSGSSGVSITSNGYIIYGGTTYSPNKECVEILKVDSNGNSIWGKYFPNKNYNFTWINISNEIGVNVPWGGEIMAGMLQNDTTGFYNWGLYRFGNGGDTVWTKNYKDSTDFWVDQIKITRDKKYLIYGEWVNNKDYPIKVAIIKTDSLGNKIWQKTYGGNSTCLMSLGIDTCKDGGFILSAQQYDSLYYCTGKIVVIKTDSLGNVQWKKTLNSGSPCEAEPSGIIALKHGGYAICGYYDDSFDYVRSYYYSALYILKLSPAGNIVWSKQYASPPPIPWEGEQSLWALKEQANGNLLSCGYVVDSTSHLIGCILKVDSDGNQQWLRPYINSSILEVYNLSDIQLTKDGGFVSSGEGGDTISIWVVKTDSLGVSTGISPLHETILSEIRVYPNPGNGVFQLILGSYEQGTNNTVEIYNVLGEKIYSQFNILHYPFSINLSGQPQGVYLYRVISANGELVGEGKIVIEK